MKARRTARNFPLALLGLLATLAVFAAALTAGGDPSLYLEPRALLLVVAGTFTVVLSGSDLSELKGLRALPQQLRRLARCDPGARMRELVHFAERARREEPRTLESELTRLPPDSLLHRGLARLLEGRADDDLEALLARELAHAGRPFTTAAALLRRAGETAPAMGLVGTVVGLVAMLARLDRPEDIGPAMAVALLTTLYGVVLAHALLLPLARRAEGWAARSRLLAELERLTVLAIARRDPPAFLQGRLEAVLGAAR